MFQIIFLVDALNHVGLSRTKSPIHFDLDYEVITESERVAKLEIGMSELFLVKRKSRREGGHQIGIGWGSNMLF